MLQPDLYKCKYRAGVVAAVHAHVRHSLARSGGPLHPGTGDAAGVRDRSAEAARHVVVRWPGGHSYARGIAEALRAATFADGLASFSSSRPSAQFEVGNAA